MLLILNDATMNVCACACMCVLVYVDLYICGSAPVMIFFLPLENTLEIELLD